MSDSGISDTRSQMNASAIIQSIRQVAQALFDIAKCVDREGCIDSSKNGSLETQLRAYIESSLTREQSHIMGLESISPSEVFRVAPVLNRLREPDDSSHIPVPPIADGAADFATITEAGRVLAAALSSHCGALLSAGSSEVRADALLTTLLGWLEVVGSELSGKGQEGVALIDSAHASAARTVVDLLMAQHSPTENSPYRILQGELQGFSSLIYDIQTPEGHRGQARMLRGRSFYCLLMANALAELLMADLELPSSQILWRGGELFQALVPNTADMQDKLTVFQMRVGAWMNDHHQGILGLALESVPTTVACLNGQGQGILEPILKLKQKLGKAEFRPFASGRGIKHRVFAASDDHRTCTVCGADYASLPDDAWNEVADKGIWGPEYGWKPQSEDAEDFLQERCLTCNALYKLGGWLTRSQWVLGLRGQEDTGRILAELGASLKEDVKPAEEDELRKADPAPASSPSLFYIRVGPSEGTAWWWIFAPANDDGGAFTRVFKAITEGRTSAAGGPIQAATLYRLSRPELSESPTKLIQAAKATPLPVPVARRTLWAATTAPLAPKDFQRTSKGAPPTAQEAARSWGLRVLDFDELAQLSEGAPYLAAAKLDLDHFGILSAVGLPAGSRTLAHQISVSRRMGRFFLGTLNDILEPSGARLTDPASRENRRSLLAGWTFKARAGQYKDSPGENVSEPPGGEPPASERRKWCSVTRNVVSKEDKRDVIAERREREQEASSLFCLRPPDGDLRCWPLSQVYVFFVGGDDVFIAGPWKAVIEACWQISRELSRFLGCDPDNPQKASPQRITISAGISLFRAGTPVRLFARAAARALEHDAKEKGGRNAISALGSIAQWTVQGRGNSSPDSKVSFSALYEDAQRLASAIDDSQDSDGGEGELKTKVSRQALHRLLTLKRARDEGDIAWNWRVPYTLARAGVFDKDAALKKTLLDLREHFDQADFPLTYALLAGRGAE